jgi:hypothetical protein
MLFHPFQVLQRLRPSHALSRSFLAPRLPLLLAVHAIRCISHARQDGPYRRSERVALSQAGGQTAADGNWNLVLTTPTGARNSTLSLKAVGGRLTGKQGAGGHSAHIFDGTVNGNDVAWKVSITTPMPLTLEFNGTVAGDAISGEMCLGVMGDFLFRGKRA